MFPIIYHTLQMQSSAMSCLLGAWVANRREPVREWKNCVSLHLVCGTCKGMFARSPGYCMWMALVSSSGERNSSSVFHLSFPYSFWRFFSFFLFAHKCNLRVLFKIIVISLPPKKNLVYNREKKLQITWLTSFLPIHTDIFVFIKKKPKKLNESK